jgi:S-adenosylmethionine decarboxylase
MANPEKVALYGFNNLTKTLSFNIYDVCCALSEEQKKAYIEYIDEQYNAERLTEILSNVAKIIGANILNIAKQDYDPQGASVTILVCEEEFKSIEPSYNNESPGPDPDELEVLDDLIHTVSKESVVGHLDKSHITAHTYPECHPDKGISTFRTDIDVSTCGQISPLKALNYLIHSFDSDIINLDYRIRGFTRDVSGKKHFKDHKINSIQNYMTKETRQRYQMIDVNVYSDNLFHTKMILKDFDLDNYLFNTSKKDLSTNDKKKLKKQLNREMLEIFYAHNIPKGQVKVD